MLWLSSSGYGRVVIRVICARGPRSLCGLFWGAIAGKLFPKLAHMTQMSVLPFHVSCVYFAALVLDLQAVLMDFSVLPSSRDVHVATPEWPLENQQ